MIMALLTRYPILVWAGAALLGWIAGELHGQRPDLPLQLQAQDPTFVVPAPETAIGIKASGFVLYTAAVVGVLIVLLGGWLLKKRHRPEAEHKSAAE